MSTSRNSATQPALCLKGPNARITIQELSSRQLSSQSSQTRDAIQKDQRGKRKVGESKIAPTATRASTEQTFEGLKSILASSLVPQPDDRLLVNKSPLFEI